MPGLSSGSWGWPTSQGSPTSGYQASEVTTDVLIYVSPSGIWNWANGAHGASILSFLGLGGTSILCVLLMVKEYPIPCGSYSEISLLQEARVGGHAMPVSLGETLWPLTGRKMG